MFTFIAIWKPQTLSRNFEESFVNKPIIEYHQGIIIA